MAAVIDGEYAVKVTDSRVQPAPFDINIFILTVYERRNGQWQQIAWQSTRDVGAPSSSTRGKGLTLPIADLLAS